MNTKPVVDTPVEIIDGFKMKFKESQEIYQRDENVDETQGVVDNVHVLNVKPAYLTNEHVTDYMRKLV